MRALVKHAILVPKRTVVRRIRVHSIRLFWRSTSSMRAKISSVVDIESSLEDWLKRAPRRHGIPPLNFVGGQKRMLKCHSIKRNRSRTLRRSLNTSSSASGQECAIGPRRAFNLEVTPCTARLLLNIDPNKSQLLVIMFESSPKVVKSSGSVERGVTPESTSRCIRSDTSLRRVSSIRALDHQFVPSSDNSVSMVSPLIVRSKQ